MANVKAPTDHDKPLLGDSPDDQTYLRSVFAKQLSALTGISEKGFDLTIAKGEGRLAIGGFGNDGKQPTRAEVRQKLKGAGINSTEQGDLIIIDSTQLDDLVIASPNRNGKQHDAMPLREQIRDRLVETTERKVRERRYKYEENRLIDTNQRLGRGTRITIKPSSNGDGRSRE